jgi:peptide/nickel transport system substrate-binding protein
MNLKQDDLSIKDNLICGLLRPERFEPFPITSENWLTVIPNVYETLVEFDANFRVMPALAVSWVNPDNLTWLFKLRPEVKFHNGENFTAEDVKLTLENSLYKYYHDTIENITIVDEHTIKIRTYKSSPSILPLAYDCYIFCKNATSDQGFAGTGPYKITDYEPGNYMKLELFENYWGEPPKINTVYFKSIENTTKRVDALVSGEIDIAEYFMDEQYDDISRNSNVTVVTYPPLTRFILGFDMRENGSYAFPDGDNPTADIRVRKAIYQAINVTALINGPCKGLAEPISQFFSSAVFGYNPEIKRLPYNITESRRLLAEAGYENGFNITVDNLGQGYNILSSVLIAKQLAEVGIHVTLTNLSFIEFEKKVLIERNTSMYLVGYSVITVDGGSEYDYFIRSVSQNTGQSNSGYYSNPDVDRIGVEASHEMVSQTRLQLLQEGFRIALVDDIAYVPLFAQKYTTLKANNVIFTPRGDLRLIIKDIRFV